MKKVHRRAGRSQLRNYGRFQPPVDCSPRDKNGNPWKAKFYQRVWFCFFVIYLLPVIVMTLWTSGGWDSWGTLIIGTLYGYLWAFGAPGVCLIISQMNEKYYLPGAKIYIPPKEQPAYLGSGWDIYFTYHSLDGHVLDKPDYLQGMMWD